jgi:hypothetical protein
MGLYSTVYIPCPVCGRLVEFQSDVTAEDGFYVACSRSDDVPIGIAASLAGAETQCKSCGSGVAIPTDIEEIPKTVDLTNEPFPFEWKP